MVLRENTHLVSSGDTGATERPAMQWLTFYFPYPTREPTPGPTTGPVNLGDVNADGVIDIIDSLKIAQFYVGLNPGDFNKAMADTDFDDVITIVDALVVSQYYVDLITEFCE